MEIALLLVVALAGCGAVVLFAIAPVMDGKAFLRKFPGVLRRTQTISVQVPTSTETPARSESERRALVNVCIGVVDHVQSEALRARLLAGLADAGVHSISPVGDRFDPALHAAADYRLTVDPALVGRVADTERLGFDDHGVLLREPQVVVYRLEG